MCEKCAPSIPVNRLIGHSGFGYSVGCIEADTSDDTQEIMSLGRCLMWNDAVVFGGRVKLNSFVRVWSYMWKSLDMESAMMFSVPLMCYDYMDVLLLTRVQPSQRDTELCDSSLTG